VPLTTTELDRPARSFQDGGFSYGNTVDAILRTIVHGIPGTPMPTFDGALPESDLRRLAQHGIEGVRVELLAKDQGPGA